MKNPSTRFAVGAFVATSLLAGSASANDYVLPVDVTRVLESSYAWFESQASQASKSHAQPVRPTAAPDKVVESTPLKTKPPVRLSLVARDWSQAYSITGGANVADGMRLTKSMRMLVGRARLDLGAVQPFVHVGLGEWRVDPVLMQVMPHNREFASQLAAGVEIRFSSETKLAMEADYTLLVRESREPNNLPTPRVLGAFAVMKSRF